MFMVLYDIMRNADRVSLGDIVSRQHALGGINLFRLRETSSYKYFSCLDRIYFINEFYAYAESNSDGFKTTWSEWLAGRQPLMEIEE